MLAASTTSVLGDCRILVLGATSYIGENFIACLPPNVYVGTSYSQMAPNLIRFNILSDNTQEILDRYGPFTHAIIMSAIANPDSCFKNKVLSQRINVSRTIDVINCLVKNSVFPVFTSTEAVFDGIQGNYTETCLPSPVLLYGKQKYSVEQYLASLDTESLIVRISRAFSTVGPKGRLLTSIMDSLISNHDVCCATDQIMTPIHVSDLCNALTFLIKARKSGIYNLAGPTSMSRYRIAKLLHDIYKQEHAYEGNLSGCRLSSFHAEEARPLNTSLSNHKLQSECDFEIRSIDYWCKKLVQDYVPKHAIH